MIRPKRQIRVDLYITGEHAKGFFAQLKRQKDAIEHELGYALEWEELPTGQDSRIATYLNDVDPDDRDDWPRQHGWLAKRLSDLHRVFASRVDSLDVDTQLSAG